MTLESKINEIVKSMGFPTFHQWDSEPEKVPLTPCIIKAMIQEVMRSVPQSSYVWALCSYVLANHSWPAEGEPLINPSGVDWRYTDGMLPDGRMVQLLLTRYTQGKECRSSVYDTLRRYAAVSRILRGSLQEAYLCKLIADSRYS